MHKNNEIPKVEKFSYLKPLLDGAAARAIQGLTLSDANYDSAITMLQEQFGKPQAIITAYMEELLKVPVIAHIPYSQVMIKLLSMFEAWNA